MRELLPAILVHDETTFHERVRAMEGVATTIHLDVMDGAFVPQATWFNADVIRNLRTPLRFELHLLVRDPERIISETEDTPSIIRLLWHLETERDHETLIKRCHATRREAGIAISPRTPLERLSPFAPHIDEALILGNEPGYSGQSLLPHTKNRVRELHAAFPHLCLGFDIGVNQDTMPALLEAGVSRFCAASAIFDRPDPAHAFTELRHLL